MGVALARHAVGGPARMGDTDMADDRHLSQGLFERAHLAYGTQALQMTGIVEHGDAGRVIAAVFQALEPIDQYRNDIAPGDAGDYSAHDFSASLYIKSGL